MPPISIMQIKEIVNAGLNAPLEAALMLERKAFQLQFATRDQKEGMRAFIEKENRNLRDSDGWRLILPEQISWPLYSAPAPWGAALRGYLHGRPHYVAVDARGGAVTEAIAAIDRGLEGLVSKGRMTADDKRGVLRMQPIKLPRRGQQHPDIAIEAIVEDLDTERRLSAHWKSVWRRMRCLLPTRPPFP